MKYKKSMIILFITIFLFSIAGACASDANATATATVNDYITDEINVIESNNPAPDDSQILGSSADNEILKDPTTVTNHTFDAIESAITEGYNTIYLEPAHTQETARLILRIMQIVSPSLGIPQYWMDRD